MRPGYDENPLNPVPPVVWMLALPIILSEAAFGLAQAGFIGGGRYAGGVLRQLWVERTAVVPEMFLRMWQWGEPGVQLYRLLSYPFVHYSATHAVFVTVFLLALGNMVAQQIRQQRQGGRPDPAQHLEGDLVQVLAIGREESPQHGQRRRRAADEPVFGRGAHLRVARRQSARPVRRGGR